MTLTRVSPDPSDFLEKIQTEKLKWEVAEFDGSVEGDWLSEGIIRRKESSVSIWVGREFIN